MIYHGPWGCKKSPSPRFKLAEIFTQRIRGLSSISKRMKVIVGVSKERFEVLLSPPVSSVCPKRSRTFCVDQKGHVHLRCIWCLRTNSLMVELTLITVRLNSLLVTFQSWRFNSWCTSKTYGLSCGRVLMLIFHLPIGNNVPCMVIF